MGRKTLDWYRAHVSAERRQRLRDAMAAHDEAMRIRRRKDKLAKRQLRLPYEDQARVDFAMYALLEAEGKL